MVPRDIRPLPDDGRGFFMPLRDGNPLSAEHTVRAVICKVSAENKSAPWAQKEEEDESQVRSNQRAGSGTDQKL